MENHAASWLVRLACLFGLAAALIVPSSAQGGDSGWRLCNSTSYVIEAATGRPDGEDVIVGRLDPHPPRPVRDRASRAAEGRHLFRLRPHLQGPSRRRA